MIVCVGANDKEKEVGHATPTTCTSLQHSVFGLASTSLALSHMLYMAACVGADDAEAERAGSST